MTRVRVFVDYQNVYHRARGTFELEHEHPIVGHVRPSRLGALLNLLGKESDPRRTLDRVCLFRGEPGQQAHPAVLSSFQRQVAIWRTDPLLDVTTRPLRYPVTAWSNGRPTAWGTPEEKGIDVLLALAMVMGAIHDEYDVAVLMSSDTDLIPAIDQVITIGKRVENAVWWPDHGAGRQLRATAPHRIWCHRLGRAQFEQVRDETDYTT